MIVLEADRVEWGQPVVTPGGGVRQEVRLHEGSECKVVLAISYPASSEIAQRVVDQLRQSSGVPVINTSSVASDLSEAAGS